MPFIKSHSNYVLKAKHQDVNDGTIFERDITTIGGVNQFSPGQTPIYRSNNFIITVRNDGRPSNQYNTSKWKENENGDTWTLQTISGMVSDFEDDNDTKIVLKQDYYDFRDFAYYGSLTELFRASVTDILARFPGELYFTSEHAYYTVRESYDFNKIETLFPIGGYKEGSETEPKYYLISNPFNINLHAEHKPTDADPLKYFADEGYLNYQVGFGTKRTEGCDEIEDIKWCDITGWEVVYHDPCSKLPDSCQCSDLDIEKWDPSNCDCDNIHAEIIEDSCGCNNIASTELRSSGSKLSRKGTLRASEDESEEESEEYYRRVAEITITIKCDGEDETNITIYAYLDDNNKIIYMTDSEELVQQNVHIRPRKKDKPHYFLDIFYSESDNFEKLLVNEDTHYNATFSVIRENDYGYYREFVPFQFPTDAGGYNLDATDYGFNAYTKQMVQIGEYYDENFTDNLWRSMTHEAIKNFDWTYTREYEVGDEEEYVLGGQRIQKSLRIFAREFDEIISYINNIKNLNRVTYDERGNLPDYFLTDTVENEGWDVKLVYPYELREYYFIEEFYFGDTKYDTKEEAIAAAKAETPQEQGESEEDYEARIEGLVTTVVTDKKEECKDADAVICEEGDDDCEESPSTRWIEGGDEDCEGQLNNRACDHDIIREFSQNSTTKTKPYTKNMLDPSIRDGYFMLCSCDGSSISEDDKIPHCGYDETSYSFVSTDCEALHHDECALSNQGALKNRFKTYTDETEWSYQQVNNEFLRRLKLNSRYIWRHKGTQEGIEMILGMFGMKSRRWVEAQPEWTRDCKYTDEEGHMMWDYDMKEYTSFTSRIEETWDAIHQNYRINWINSTKAITYDNRFLSNYNKYGANPYALPYQGIPVSYREAYISEEGKNAYLKYGEGDNDYYRDENNNKIIKRYLYPNFNKNEEIDGNPYFQMRGGWMSKTIVGDTKKSTTEGEEGETPIWNFQFDVDDKIVFNRYLGKGKLGDDGFIYDNVPLYKETVRNIRRVDSVSSLLTIPTVELYNGVICYVTRIEKNSAVIDNIVYPITKEWHRKDVTSEETEEDGEIVSYVTFTKNEGFIKVGTNKFFDTTIIVYDVDGEEHLYNVDEMADGDMLRAYIVDGTFICQEDENRSYSISNFQILEDEGINNFTNYFMLDDINYADTLAKFENETIEGEEGEVEPPTTEPLNGWTNGWRRLSYSDKEYLKISTITNYYKGNNPHNGNMIYDNGHEYFTYFNRIFKHAADNDLFDERCYEDYYATLDSEITFYGFSGLIESYEDILQYDDFLVEDSKIHYFGNYKVKKGEARSAGTPNIDKIWIYGDDTYYKTGTPIEVEEGEEPKNRGGYDKVYFIETQGDSDKIEMYNLSANTIIVDETQEEENEGEGEGEDVKRGWIEKINPYNGLIEKEDTIIVYDEKTEKYVEKTVKRYPVMDEVTNQVVNNKIFDITFRLHNTFNENKEKLSWYSNRVQEELKYIDDIVMNYLTQMIPSTAILRIRYEMSDVISTITE